MFKFTRYHIELAYASGVRNFSGLDLRGIDLGGVDLSWASLSEANLTKTNLRWVNLSGANLTRAKLSGASLSGASLSMSNGVRYAQCSFAGHGEAGRQLLLVEIDNQLIFFCGCFSGSRVELAAFIEAGWPDYKESRNAAKDFLLSVI